MRASTVLAIDTVQLLVLQVTPLTPPSAGSALQRGDWWVGTHAVHLPVAVVR